MRCTNTPNSVKVDFYTSKCKKKVKFNRKIVSLVGESFYTKGCKSVKVNFYTLWCNGQHSKEYPYLAPADLKNLVSFPRYGHLKIPKGPNQISLYRF